MRPKGIVVYSSPENPLVKQAEANQRKERLRLQTARAERRERRYANAPNHITYRNVVFFVGKNIDENGRWLGGKLPPCNVCGGTIHPQEHHKCEGFVPKFRERTQEDWENIESKREERRQERRQARWEREEEQEEFDEAAWEARTVECRRCGAEVYGINDEHECEDQDFDGE